MKQQGNFGIGVKVNNSPVQAFEQQGYEYFPVPHAAEYKLVLRNDGPTRTDVEVKIDGEKVGTWQLGPYQTADIERPTAVSRKFQFFKEDSHEAQESGIQSGKTNNGVVEAHFKPEREQQRWRDTDRCASFGAFGASRGEEKCLCKGGAEKGASKGASRGPTPQSSFSSGATALGAHSTQRFGTVSAVTDVDHSREQVIRLRLVAESPRPLALGLALSGEAPPRIEVLA